MFLNLPIVHQKKPTCLPIILANLISGCAFTCNVKPQGGARGWDYSHLPHLWVIPIIMNEAKVVMNVNMYRSQGIGGDNSYTYFLRGDKSYRFKIPLS
jgi:hypothetical protein